MDRRALGIGWQRDAQALRGPARRFRPERRQPRVGLLAAALERGAAQAPRRPARQRRTLRDTIIAERTCEMRIEPFRIVAGNPGRRAIEAWRRKPHALGLAQRARRMTAILDEARDRGEIELAL